MTTTQQITLIAILGFFAFKNNLNCCERDGKREKETKDDVKTVNLGVWLIHSCPALLTAAIILK